MLWGRDLLREEKTFDLIEVGVALADREQIPFPDPVSYDTAPGHVNLDHVDVEREHNRKKGTEAEQETDALS